MSPDQAAQLPDAIYRVAVKCLIMDELGRLLVVKNEEGLYEIPGGGWEFDETIEECVERELDEELGAVLSSISDVEMVLRGIRSTHGWHVVRLVVRVTLASDDLRPGDDIVEYAYVNRNEFVKLAMDSTDQEFQTATDRIWGE